MEQVDDDETYVCDCVVALAEHAHLHSFQEREALTLVTDFFRSVSTHAFDTTGLERVSLSLPLLAATLVCKVLAADDGTLSGSLDRVTKASGLTRSALEACLVFLVQTGLAPTQKRNIVYRF